MKQGLECVSCVYASRNLRHPYALIKKKVVVAEVDCGIFDCFKL